MIVPQETITAHFFRDRSHRRNPTKLGSNIAHQQAMQNRDSPKFSHLNFPSHVQKLQDEIKELEAFNYALAHELRAPLMTIRGYARQLAELHVAILPTDARMRLGRIDEVAARMERLIDDTIAFARNSRSELVKQSLEVAQIVRDVLVELQPRYPATRVVVSELPIVEAEPTLARQVVFNLVENAMKYSALAENPLIQLGVDKHGHLYVEDNGIGFGMQHAKVIFEPFERISRSPQYTGSGIGLAIARRILQRHGGWIRAESREGGPTTFTFSFEA